MSEFRYTPGPWVVGACDGGWTCIKEKNYQNSIIAKLSLNNEANAYLIAAAPELLEALPDPDRLELLAAYFDMLQAKTPEWTSYEVQTDLRHWANLARQARIKATGGIRGRS
jgi:hypothetical protein